MIQDFVKGIVFGGVVAGFGLGVVSELAPRTTPSNQAMATTEQGASEAASSTPALPTAKAVPPAAVPDAVTSDQPADAAALEPKNPDQAATPEVADAEADVATQTAAIAAAPPEKVSTDTVQTGAAPAEPATTGVAEVDLTAPLADAPAAVAVAPQPPTVTSDVPTAPKQPAVGTAPDLTEESDPATLPTVPEALPAASDTDNPPLADAAPAAPVTEAETPAGAEAEVLLIPEPEAAPALPAQVAMDQPVPSSEPKVLEPPTSAGLPSASNLPKTVDGVTTGRLPSIGTAPAVVTDPPAAVADEATPLIKFARSFSNDADKPLFVVVLQDTGATDLDREALAALPFPISFVIDPSNPNAAEAAKIYRSAGQEVIMLASGIPAGATASDIEQSFQANAAVLPESVAVMDSGIQGFQDNRPMAAQIVPLIAGQGRGLITFDKGLNAADQIARRDAVPSAVIFRELDTGQEDAPLIRRYLDRAAFKAAQEGRVVVLGTTRPDMIAALMEWTVEGRGASVALAPVTAVLAK